MYSNACREMAQRVPEVDGRIKRILNYTGNAFFLAVGLVGLGWNLNQT